MSDETIERNGHTYPSRYAPGPEQPWYLNEAWEILDTIKPGLLPSDVRALLAGQIAGKLSLHSRSDVK